MSIVHEIAMDEASLLSWLDGDYSHVLEYSADLHRAYIADEDDEDGKRFIPVALSKLYETSTRFGVSMNKFA